MTHHLTEFAASIYKDEPTLAAKTSELEHFLSAVRIDRVRLRRMLDEQAIPGRPSHASRYLDQICAIVGVGNGIAGPIRLLEVGVCNTTRLYHEFCNVEITSAGLPWHKPAAAIAAECGSVAHHYVDFDIEALSEKRPELTGKFDVVVFCEVIEHIHASPTEQIADLLALLKPGGHIIMSTPNALARGWVARLATGRMTSTIYSREKMKAGRAHDYHVREYTPKELREAITEAGGAIFHEGLFNWYGPQMVDEMIPHVSGRQGMMFIVRK